MILDIENNDGQLIISYFDSEGRVKIKDYRMEECQNWAVCSPRDPNQSTEFKNWDGKPVKKVKDKRLNKFSVYEFIDTLPEEEKSEITALNFPKVQSIDIETEVIDSFPDPEIER